MTWGVLGARHEAALSYLAMLTSTTDPELAGLVLWSRDDKFLLCGIIPCLSLNAHYVRTMTLCQQQSSLSSRSSAPGHTRMLQSSQSVNVLLI